MTRFFFQIFVGVFGALSIFLIHLLLNGLLFYPINHINFIFLVMLWLIIFYGRTRIVWIFLPLAFLIEIFSSVPFGINSISLLVSFFILYWLMFNIFTNRSVLTIFLLAVIGMSLYRFLYLLILFILTFFDYDFYFSWEIIYTQIIAEIAITALIATLVYLIASLFIKRLDPKYLPGDKSTIYGQRII